VVDLSPLDVVDARGGVDGAVDVVHDAELLEHQLEEGAPSGVVGVLKIQDLWHMGADVDELAHGGGNGRRSRSVEGVEILSSRGVGGRRARSHGVRIGSRLS
jgi:hypothetical protein